MNEHNCPICGLQNDCQVAGDEGSCWCMSIVVPEALIAQLDDTDKNVRCICKNCIEQYKTKNTL